MKSKRDIEFRRGHWLWIFVFLFSFGIRFSCPAQNLVPNPSFEVYTYCPVGAGAVGNLPATPWQSATNGTPDYFNVCAVAPDFSVPNGFGYQEAHTGMAYMGFILYEYDPDSTSYREYLQAPLIGGALDGGYVYHVSFYVSLGDNTCAIDKIGAYFSSSRPPASIRTPLLVKPQIEANLGIMRDSINWVLVSGCFISKGYEQWITIGNFYDNGHTASDPTIDCFSYYLIDDIEVVKAGLPGIIPLDLGDTVTSCGPYLILPGVANVKYDWSNGSHDSTLYVVESGTYTLTITDGCEQGIDSIEVIIKASTIIDLGPPEFELCDDDSIVISLDSSLGQYTWQDGSIGNEYIISDSGFYKVTLNNGACETTDEMLVTSLDSPSPFSLGGDTILCSGEILSLTPGIHGVDYKWQDGSTLSVYEVTSPDSILLQVSNECGSVSDTLLVNFLSPPISFDLGPDTILCPGDTLILNSPSLEYSILWQDGSQLPQRLIDHEDTYVLELSNACGITSDSRVFQFDKNIPVLDLDDIIHWCENDTITLDASQSFDATYHWNTGSVFPVIRVYSPGIYSIDVLSACSEIQDVVQIVVDPSCENTDGFYFPTVFSPNEDGVNDVYFVYAPAGSEIISLEGNIFDRWGDLIYHSSSLSFSWDGRSRQGDVQSGVYVAEFKIKYLINGIEKQRNYYADISLIR